jgi:hypothetical protein
LKICFDHNTSLASPNDSSFRLLSESAETPETKLRRWTPKLERLALKRQHKSEFLGDEPHAFEWLRQLIGQLQEYSLMTLTALCNDRV